MGNFGSITSESIRQRHTLRSWIQECGCAAGGGTCQPLAFWGADCRLFEIAMVEENMRGQLTPLHLLKNDGSWFEAASVERPPGRQQFALNYFESCIPYLPYFHSLGEDTIHVYETVGDCSDIGDPANGWSAYVKIHSGVLFEKRRSQGRTARASQDPIDNQLMGTVADVLYYAPVRFATFNQNLGTRVAAMAYSYSRGCAVCGDSCNGSGCGTRRPDSKNRLYALVQSGANIYVDAHRLDYGDIVRSDAIAPVTDIASAISYPMAIAVFQGYVVVGLAGTSIWTGIYYAKINADGTLGTFQRGLTAAVQSLEPVGRRLIVGGWSAGSLMGRIVSACDPSCQRLVDSFWFYDNVGFWDIDAYGKSVIAGGDDGALAVSVNGGVSWRIIASPAGDTTTAVATTGIGKYWVASEQGDLYYTCNSGVDWSIRASVTNTAPIQLTGDVDSGIIRNIEFANAHVGYFTSGNQLFSTYDGGTNWGSGCPRFDSAPNAQPGWASTFRYTALAIPKGSHHFTASNFLSVAGGDNTANSYAYYGEPIVEELLSQVNYTGV